MLMENVFCASKLSLILTETRQTRSLCIPAILSFADFSVLDLSNIPSLPPFFSNTSENGQRLETSLSPFFFIYPS